MKNWLFNVWNVAKIELLQKIRQKNTLAILVFLMLFTFFCFPDRNSTLNFSISLRREDILSARGFYNSDWIGMLIIIYFSTVLLFIGIFLIRKTMRREQLDGYGMLMASSNVNKSAFFEGKRLGNFLYLAGLMLIIEFFGMIIQLLRNESSMITISSYLIPYLIIILPLVYLLSTLEIIFEVMPLLKGTLGNFFIFMVAMILVSSSLINLEYSKNSNILVEIFDIGGFKYCLKLVLESFVATYGGSIPGFNIFGISPPTNTFFTFHFKWEPAFIATRVILILFTFSLLYFVQWVTPLVSIFSIKNKHKLKKKTASTIETTNLQTAYQTCSLQPKKKIEISVKYVSSLRLFYYQALLVIRERPIAIFMVALIFIAQWVLIRTKFNEQLLILATIIPISIWAQIGFKKAEDYLKTTLAYPKYFSWRLLLIEWLVWLLYFSGTIVKSLMLHNLTGVGIVSISSLLVVSFAYASNSIFHNELPFEILFLFVWYIDIFQKAKFINLFNPYTQSMRALIFLLIGWIGFTILGIISNYLVISSTKNFRSIQLPWKNKLKKKKLSP